jgi:hypothetical protein
MATRAPTARTRVRHSGRLRKHPMSYVKTLLYVTRHHNGKRMPVCELLRVCL